VNLVACMAFFSLTMISLIDLRIRMRDALYVLKCLATLIVIWKGSLYALFTHVTIAR
jgi:hypothetical protein